MPTPDQIRKARSDAGLTQVQAARLSCKTLSTYKNWEAGRQNMPACCWELFGLKLAALDAIRKGR